MSETGERLATSPRRRRRRAPNHKVEKARRALELGALSVFGLTIVGGPLLLGGAVEWAIWAIAGMSALSLLAAIAVRQPSVLEARLPLGIVFIVAIGWTAIQAVPLPCAVVRIISPGTASEADAAAAVIGEHAPAMCTLSLDPGATRIEIAKLAAAFACFLAAGLLASSGMRRSVYSLVATSVIAMMCAAYLHSLLQLDKVFGLYRPMYAKSNMLAPLMNPNHLAAFVGMGIPLLIAFGMREEFHKGRRWLWFFGAALAAVCVCATGSVSGIGSMIFGFAAFGALILARRRSNKRSARAIRVVVAGLVIGLAVMVGSLFETVTPSATSRTTTRAGMVAKAMVLAAHHPIFGVGRGAYSSAFVRHAGGQERFAYPENIVSQWTSEWGFVAALFLLFVVGREVYRRTKIFPSTISLAALAGLIALLAHDFFDFSLELVGVGMVASSLFGALIAPSGTNLDDFAKAPGDGTKLRYLIVPGLAASVLAALLLGPMLERWSAECARQRLVAAMQTDDRVAFRDTLRAAVRLHPAEPALALLAGAEATAHSDPEAPRWFTRAMVLAPGWASPHVEAARYLIVSGHQDQALLELREAAARDAQSAIPLACDIVKHSPTAAIALRSAPWNTSRVAYLDALAGCLPPATDAVRALDREITRLVPNHPSPRLRHARAALRAGQVDVALAEASSLVRQDPRLLPAQLLLGESLIAARRYQEAATAMRDAEANFGNPSPLIEMRARADAARGDAIQMRRAIDELRGLASGSRQGLASAMILLGKLETQLGNDGRAVEAYEEAFGFVPHVSTLEALAICAERLGNHEKAYQAYTRLVELQPNNPRYRAAKARLVGSSP